MMVRHTHVFRLDRIPAAQAARLRPCAIREADGLLTLDKDSECYRVLFPSARRAAKATPASTAGPGDVVKLVLARLGYTTGGGCGCETMRRQMNDWGWWGCWKRRDELVTWFAAKAAESGVTVDRKTVLGLLVAAWRERR